MLDSIKQTVQQIADFFATIIDFVVGFVKDTVNFIAKLPEAISDVLEMAESFFPVEILTLFGAALAMVVILRVLGRD